MQYETIKNKDQLPKFEGIIIDFEKQDDQIISVNIIDNNSGAILKVIKGGTYTDTLKVLGKKQPEFVDRWVASIKTEDGLTSSLKFDTETEAREHVYEMQCKYTIVEQEIKMVKDTKEDNSI